MLGADWRAAAGARLGHDRRGESQYARLDNGDPGRAAGDPLPRYRNRGEEVERYGEEWPWGLFFRLSPAVHGREVFVPSGLEALFQRRFGNGLRISLGIYQRSAASTGPAVDPLSAPATVAKAAGRGNHVEVRVSQESGVELSIIFVNWNSFDQLRESLRTVFATLVAIEYEVIVVDNASSAGDAARVQAEFCGVKVMPSTKNLGVAAARNLGVEHPRGISLPFLDPRPLA